MDAAGQRDFSKSTLKYLKKIKAKALEMRDKNVQAASDQCEGFKVPLTKSHPSQSLSTQQGQFPHDSVASEPLMPAEPKNLEESNQD